MLDAFLSSNQPGCLSDNFFHVALLRMSWLCDNIILIQATNRPADLVAHHPDEDEGMTKPLPNIDPEFVVIFASAWCNDRGVGISYSCDGQRFNNRNDAIKHGLRTRGSDDFNIGQTYGDDLIWFGWMDQRMDEDEETMRQIAEGAGLTFDPRWHSLEFSKATGRPTGWKVAA